MTSNSHTKEDLTLQKPLKISLETRSETPRNVPTHKLPIKYDVYHYEQCLYQLGLLVAEFEDSFIYRNR